MKKTLAIVISILLVSVAFYGCGSNSGNTGTASAAPSQANASTEAASQPAGDAPQKAITIKLASNRDDTDPSTFAVKKFAEIVGEKTNGQIEVKVFNNSQLGTVNDMMTGMTAGTVEMMHDRISSYGNLEGASMFNICSAPFIWESDDELEAFLNSDFTKDWYEQAIATTGVRVVAAKGGAEARQLTCNKPVANADDFKGLKVRTAESVVVQSTMKALGAQPMVIPFNDLYMALRQGTVDAQENGFITIQNRSFFEVQKYLMRTDYLRDISTFYISDNFWQGLSTEHQQIITDAANEASDLCAEMTRESVEEAFAFLKENMEYIEIDLDSVRAKLTDAYESLDGQAWAAGSYDVAKAFKASK